MQNGNGVQSTATVNITVNGFTEGMIINSGVTGTMTFNNATRNTAPLSYTEANLTVQSLFNPSQGPHLHFDGSNLGDPSQELMNHSGCCSTPYEFRYYNPNNTDTTFSLQSIQHLSGTGLWTSSKGGSVTVSSVGTISFAGNAAFQDVEWVRWHVTSGNDYIDNFVFTA
jgi:hypothetical protein